MSIQKLFGSRRPNVSATTYVGSHGNLFYDEATGLLRISDGVTPGGHVLTINPATTTVVGGIKAGAGANVSIDGTLTIDTTGLPLSIGNLSISYANISTTNANQDLNLLTNGTGNINLIGNLRVQTTSAGLYSTPVFEVDNRGNLTVNGNLITNGGTYLVGTTTFVGPAVHEGNLVTNGNLITVGSSYFQGNITEVGNLLVIGNAINNGNSVFNGLSTFNGNTVRNGDTVSNGNITWNGNTTTNGVAVNNGATIFNGNTTFVVATQNSVEGAVEITGDTNGLWQTPVTTGVMLHVTGQASLPSRVYNDAMNNYALYVGRRFDGTMSAPTAVQANEDIVRFAGGVYTSTGWANIGPSRISIVSSENQTGTNQGGRIEFWTTANSAGPAYANIQRIASVDAAVGFQATQFTTAGNVTAGNIAVSASGTLSTPRVILNDGGVRQLTGNTAVTLDFSTDSMVSLTNPTGTVTITLTNYTAGAVIRFIYSSATARNIAMGVAAAVNSTTGSTTITGTGPGANYGSNQAVVLTYYCVGGTAATTYVSASYV